MRESSPTTMRISFQIDRRHALPELLFCWRMSIDVPQASAIEDVFIPELFFDFLYVQAGGIAYADRTLHQQTLKTLHTQTRHLVLRAPLDVYGARLSLAFAERYWNPELPANAFLSEDWLDGPVNDLDGFSRGVALAISQRRSRRVAVPILTPNLEESDGLAGYSPRHKRRLYRSVLGIRRQELRAIQNVHRFLARACDFSGGTPRIVEYVDDDAYYDQPHLNHAFRKVTGLSPLEYFHAPAVLQEHLMAASYNEDSRARD